MRHSRHARLLQHVQQATPEAAGTYTGVRYTTIVFKTESTTKVGQFGPELPYTTQNALNCGYRNSLWKHLNPN